MHVRDRIKELRRVKACELRPNPRNWRTHPAAQRAVLDGVLSEIGYADALLARELSDGTLELVDGHLRAEATPDQLVPVLVLDVSEAEANTLLATLDPLAAMAETSAEQLAELVGEIETENQAVQRMLANLCERNGLPDLIDQEETGDQTDAIKQSLHVLIECADEDQQRELLDRFTREGLACRALFV